MRKNFCCFFNFWSKIFLSKFLTAWNLKIFWLLINFVLNSCGPIHRAPLPSQGPYNPSPPAPHFADDVPQLWSFSWSFILYLCDPIFPLTSLVIFLVFQRIKKRLAKKEQFDWAVNYHGKWVNCLQNFQEALMRSDQEI